MTNVVFQTKALGNILLKLKKRNKNLSTGRSAIDKMNPLLTFLYRSRYSKYIYQAQLSHGRRKVLSFILWRVIRSIKGGGGWLDWTEFEIERMKWSKIHVIIFDKWFFLLPPSSRWRHYKKLKKINLKAKLNWIMFVVY